MGKNSNVLGGVSIHCRKGFVKGILETGGVMDKCVQMWTRNYGALVQTARVCFGVEQVCPDVDKELWRLGPDGSGKKKKEQKKEDKKVRGERTDGRRRRERERGDGKRVGERESEPRLEWRKGLSPEIGVKKTMNAGGVENGNMN
ncbi:hypothetical protein TNCV_3705781 [Trichonephila clavipes]|nr:hypothetical protein TNCV_3705781 [Trichonephila clavipes]